MQNFLSWFKMSTIVFWTTELCVDNGRRVRSETEILLQKEIPRQIWNSIGILRPHIDEIWTKEFRILTVSSISIKHNLSEFNYVEPMKTGHIFLISQVKQSETCISELIFSITAFGKPIEEKHLYTFSIAVYWKTIWKTRNLLNKKCLSNEYCTDGAWWPKKLLICLNLLAQSFD